MKQFKITDKGLINKLKFDDEIVGTYTKVQYTHHDIDSSKLFLIFHLINNKWIAQPVYAIGLASAINHIKVRDLKILKNEKGIG